MGLHTFQFLKLGPFFAHLQKDSSRLGKYQKNASRKALASSKTATPFEFYYLCREFTNERFSNRNVKENLEEDSGLGVSTVIQK